MRLYSIHAITLLLSALLSVSFADDLLSAVGPSDPNAFKDGRGHHIASTLAEREQWPDDDAGTCRTLCAPGSCCSSKKLRRSSSVPELDRRVLANPAAGNPTDQYVFQRTELPGLISIYTNGATGTTSEWRPIVAGGNAPTAAFDMGLKELIGCTTLVVVSPNGVYGSHHWEVPSFSPRIEDGVTTQAVTFTDSVVNYLTANGPTGLATHAADLADGYAYILTPGRKLNGAPNYRAKIPAMVTAVNQAVPNLRGVQVRTYIPLEGGRNDDGTDINPGDVHLLENTSRGRVLFQYDPNNNAERTMRLYFEQSEIFSTNL